MVSNKKIRPRGLKGASPFIWAQPERDMDSTPAASPTSSSLERMACAMKMAPVSEDAQNRLTVTDGTESGNPAADIARALVGDVHTTGRDVPHAVEGNADPLTGRRHGLPEQTVGPHMR